MLNALFMSHEQCTRCWSQKEKEKGLKHKTSKRERDPNPHLGPNWLAYNSGSSALNLIS